MLINRVNAPSPATVQMANNNYILRCMLLSGCCESVSWAQGKTVRGASELRFTASDFSGCRLVQSLSADRSHYLPGSIDSTSQLHLAHNAGVFSATERKMKKSATYLLFAEMEIWYCHVCKTVHNLHCCMCCQTQGMTIVVLSHQVYNTASEQPPF